MKDPLNEDPVASGYHLLHSDRTADGTTLPALLLLAPH